MGPAPPVYSVLPFVAMLLAIAVCPLWTPHWWESNRNKLVVSAVLGLPVLLFYGFRHPRALAHTAEDYVSFIVLLAGLYVIAGGILLTWWIVGVMLAELRALAAAPLVLPDLRLAAWGGGLFAIGWMWALVSSATVLRAARRPPSARGEP